MQANEAAELDGHQARKTEVTKSSGARPAIAAPAEESGSEGASDGGCGSDYGEEIFSDGGSCVYVLSFFC